MDFLRVHQHKPLILEIGAWQLVLIGNHTGCFTIAASKRSIVTNFINRKILPKIILSIRLFECCCVYLAELYSKLNFHEMTVVDKEVIA